ncbi:MAG TPA: formyltetrahydrofolate deformylase [Propionibacteriaceae bacterium]
MPAIATVNTLPDRVGEEPLAAPAVHHDVLTAVCPQRSGVVAAITRFLLDHGLDIEEHQQFDDRVSGQVYLRTAFTGRTGALAQLRAEFVPVADSLGMTAELHDSTRPRALVMVSRLGHCLNDLIFRWRSGSLGVDIAAVASNHTVLEPMARAAGLPFIHVPVTATTKPEAERRLLELVAEHDADLVVLARYMQVLSDDLCTRWAGRAINIHHSFLPGFKGARPYQQAYDRGVKLVGATAHYVTADLDEGPIIEQEVIRVDHSQDPAALATIGRDAEALALSRAVSWHGQHRVLLNGSSTVVFR